MAFNRKPNDEVFTIKYKPGTPISDHLRNLTTEFGRQEIGPNPTRAEMETLLNEQIAKAEKQKSELVAVPVSEPLGWSSAMAWGFGVAVIVSVGALLVKRLRR